MSRKCDICKKHLATVHLTEIQAGKQLEKHLCEHCAASQEGISMKQQPLNELLTNFVMQTTSAVKELTTSGVCEHCGMNWGDFRQHGLLGCEHDYVRFEKELTPLLQRAHEGATHHSGKTPVRRGGSAAPMKKAADLDRLRRELKKAIDVEDYERAAKLRDQIRSAEGG